MSRTIEQSKAIYRNLIKPDHGLFHQAWWWDIQCEDDGWTAYIGKDGGTVEWLWPARTQSRFGFNIITPPRFIYNTGLIWLNADREQWQEQLSNFFLSEASLIKIKDRKNQLEGLFEGSNCRNKYYQDVKIDHDTSISILNEDQVRQIKNISQKYSPLKKIESHKLGSFLEKRNISYLPKPDTILKVHKQARNYADSNCWLQYDEKYTPVAGAYNLIFNKTMYLLVAVRDKDSAAPGTMAYMQWQLYRYALQQGCHTIDLGGSSIEGVRTFNLRMGGTDHAYSEIRFEQSSVLQIARKIMEFFRR